MINTANYILELPPEDDLATNETVARIGCTSCKHAVSVRISGDSTFLDTFNEDIQILAETAGIPVEIRNFAQTDTFGPRTSVIGCNVCPVVDTGELIAQTVETYVNI